MNRRQRVFSKVQGFAARVNNGELRATLLVLGSLFGIWQAVHIVLFFVYHF